MIRTLLLCFCLIAFSQTIKLELEPLHNEKEELEKSILYPLFSNFEGTFEEFMTEYQNFPLINFSESDIQKYFHMYNSMKFTNKETNDQIQLITPRDFAFYSKVSLGTPPQNFKLLFDSGSGYVWVPGTDCKVGQCLAKDRFNPQKSSTFKNLSISHDLCFGTAGAGCSQGYFAQDYFQVGNFNISQTFLDLWSLNFSGYNLQKIDGLIGIANTEKDKTSFIQNLYDDNLISSLLFSYYITKNFNISGSFIDFGEIDSNYYTGELKYYQLQGLFFIQSASIYIHGKVVFSDYSVLFDTGTTKIALGVNDARVINNLITTVNPDCSNLQTLPVVTIKINEDDYTLEPEYYVAQYNKYFQAICFSGFLPTGNEGLIILGNFFFRKYFTVFDIQNNQIGIALAN